MNTIPKSSGPRPGLEELRLRFAAILQDLDHPPLGAGVALAEECGEVARVLLDHHAYGKPLDQEMLGSELMDIFVVIAEIATLHGIDLDAAAAHKLDDLARRAPSWRADPSMVAALRRARGCS